MAKNPIDPEVREFMRTLTPYEAPTAKVTGGKVRPGTYRSLAVLGWIERRKSWPVAGIQTILLRPKEDTHVGAVTIALPITPKTERFVNALLQMYGWDGRAWPHEDDKLWPEGTDDEPQVTALMAKIGLGATLTFPPHPEMGAPSVPLHVPKSNGFFPYAPVSEFNSPPVHLEKLRAFAMDPSPFQPTEPTEPSTKTLLGAFLH